MLYPRRGKNFVYAHITGHTDQEGWCDLPIEMAWGIFCSNLKLCSFKSTQINAFVLMNNHFHLLISEKEDKVKKFRETFVDTVAYDIEGFADPEFPVFEGGSQEFIIKDLKHLRNVYRYIYQNPVQAGLVRKAENYPFSTLGMLLGRASSEITHPVFFDTLGIVHDPIRMLRWINDLESPGQFWIH